eukprot:5925351-Prymnesium_polylepis.1
MHVPSLSTSAGRFGSIAALPSIQAAGSRVDCGALQGICAFQQSQAVAQAAHDNRLVHGHRRQSGRCRWRWRRGKRRRRRDSDREVDAGEGTQAVLVPGLRAQWRLQVLGDKVRDDKTRAIAVNITRSAGVDRGLAEDPHGGLSGTIAIQIVIERVATSERVVGCT